VNIDEVAKRLPLHKFEVLGSGNDKWVVRYYTCGNPEDAGSRSQSWVEMARSKFGSIEEAMERVLNIYLHGHVWTVGGLPDILPEEGSVSTSMTIREYCRGRDGGSPWADPENDIVKSGSLEVHIRLDKPEDGHLEWHGCYSPYYPLFAVASSYKSYLKLYEGNYPTKKETKDIVMFEWRHGMYGKPYIMPDQMCVCGTPIGPEPANLDDDEERDSDRPKIDYFEDHVRWHKRGDIVVLGGTFYLDGKAVLTVDEVMREFPDANRYSITSNGFYDCKNVLDWIRGRFPEATSIEQTNGSCSWTNFGTEKKEAGFAP
jgi:hypothetical protein